MFGKIKIFRVKKIDTLAVLIFFMTFFPFGLWNLFDARTPVLSTGSVWWDSLIAFATFVVGLAAHEGLHALTSMLFGRIKPSEIKFGIEWKNLILYTHYQKPMKKGAYLTALIVPFLVTGVLPFCLTVAFGGIITVAPCALLMAGAAGDLVMFFGLLKEKSPYISDHPTAFAVYVGGKEELLNRTEDTAEEKALLEKSGACTEAPEKKSILMKCFGILTFLGLYVLLMYLIAEIMKYV